MYQRSAPGDYIYKLALYEAYSHYLEMEFSVVGALLISCICATYSIYNNKVTFRDVDLFSPCENQPENVLDIHGLFDFSNHHYEFNDNYEIVVSGNLKTVWDIQPTDRVKVILYHTMPIRSTHL